MWHWLKRSAISENERISGMGFHLHVVKFVKITCARTVSTLSKMVLFMCFKFRKNKYSSLDVIYISAVLVFYFC